MKPTLSVVIGTFNRAHLLQRSLRAYLESDFTGLELIILDDGSTDLTLQLCNAYARQMDLKYVKLHKPAKKWRDSAAILNIGIRMASTDGLIICTHPEVVPSPHSLKQASAVSDQYREAYICCKPYYLTIDQQMELERQALETPDPNAASVFSLANVRALPDFYTARPIIASGPDYSPHAIERAGAWESWVFGGLRRDKWREIGGMWESETWGTVDVTFLERRRILGIPNETLRSNDSFVIHQNHDDPRFNVPTPRDMDLCMANVPKFQSRQDAICDYL